MKKLHVLTISKGFLFFLLILIVLILTSFKLFSPALSAIKEQWHAGTFSEDSGQQSKGGGTVTAGMETRDKETGNTETGGKLAIIIDDFGSGRDGIDEMMAIKEHLTFAVMPFLENTLEDAEIAHGNGYEVIVHLSMEPNFGRRSWLGPRPILAGMESDEVREIVKDAFDSVPYAAGANIHMGSKASNDEDIVSAILDVIDEKNVYFVDSRTAVKPKAKKAAEKKGVLCYERDVFIDGQQPKSSIKVRLEQAMEVSLKKGYAIAAGHVGQEGGKVTADAINEMLPIFKEKNIELVYVSELNEAIIFNQDG